MVDRGTTQRNTYFPLDKGLPRVIPENTIRKGKDMVGKDNCELALNYVQASHQMFDKAVASAFGSQLSVSGVLLISSFVGCVFAETEDQAKILVDRQRGIGKMIVTKQCQQFQANGTFTGGEDPKDVAMEYVNRLHVYMRTQSNANQRRRELDGE